MKIIAVTRVSSSVQPEPEFRVEEYIPGDEPVLICTINAGCVLCDGEAEKLADHIAHLLEADPGPLKRVRK